MDTRNKKALWIWRHFRLELPSDWEMLQFSRDAEKGRCAFADRYRFRLEFDWREVAGAPDFERMMRDYQSSLEAGGHDSVSPLRQDAWRGLLARGKASSTSRFGRYFPEAGCMIELVFIWPEDRDAALEQRALSAMAPEPAEPDGARRWRAFGLDARVPPGFLLDACRVQPAFASMEFSGARRHNRWRFQRLGLLTNWLRQPVADWMCSQAARARNLRRTRSDIANHQVDILNGALKPRGWLLPEGRYDAAAWICPADGRLYHVEHARPRSAPENAQPIFQRLSCCETFRGRA